MKTFILSVLLFAAMACGAFAQDTVVDTTNFFDWLRPYLLEFLSLLIGAAVLWATKKFHDLTGMNIEAKHREALQSALNNGAKLLIERVKTPGELDLKNSAAASAIRYVLESVPDAVDYFGLTPDRIAELLRPKVIANAAALPTE